ncbi:MAG: hypothetical protein IT380_09070 [Myxococcales bacterium]|nr:hypothetical protein [Myxococcales bacterium]
MSPLSLEQAPPWSVPLRFFFTAPLFGVAAGVVGAWRGAELVSTRWAPAAVAAVHLITAGFMLQVMVGALLQVLPVAAGANVWRPRLVAGVVHPLITVGAVALAAGFLGLGQPALQLATVLLGAGVTVFVVATGVALLRSPAIGPTLPTLKLAVLGLAVAAGLGVSLAAQLGFSLPLPLGALVDLHVAWATLGWGVMLVAAVAYLVVPMFQLTPPYPLAVARAVPAGLVVALVAWTGGVAFDSRALSWLGAVLGAAALLGFAAQTLALQRRRRRKVTDTTLRAWRLGMALFALAALVALVRRALPEAERLDYLAGVVMIAGAFPAVIFGMLYKIVGFLGWLHLHRALGTAPTMQQVMPEAPARWQLRVFLVGTVLLGAATAWPPLAIAGGAAYAAAFAILFGQLAAAARVQRKATGGAQRKQPEAGQRSR